MSEQTENTLTAYKGPEFQQKLMWQLLVEPEYAEKTIPILAIEYFDDPNLKRLFLIMLEYIKEYAKVPNLQNQSIIEAINEYKTPNNPIEEESLFAVIERIKLWNERVLNQTLMHDGDAVQKATTTFIKQQEYRKFAEGLLVKIKNGEIKNKRAIVEVEEKLQKISLIGNDEDNGSDATEGLEKALRKEFRKTIPTGVAVIDALTGGGLGKGEIGLILTPSGVGKTTLLTKIANEARKKNLNVLQIIFEDTKEQIQRKHVAIWTGIPLSQIDERNDEALIKSTAHINAMGPGRLTIKKFSQEDTTMKDVKDYILREQKHWGFKYDIVVLDYLDCLESHKKVSDRNEAELVIVKSFEAMASDLDIPCWSAIQSNRSGFDAELVEAHQAGGNIKRVQKAHFFMSVAKTPDQKEASLASIRIIKARFAQDGQTFKDCVFNNDTMEIRITDEKYVGGAYSNKKRYSETVINGKAEAIESHTGLMHVVASNAVPDSPENPLLGDMRDKFLEQNNVVEKKPLDTSQFVSPGISIREIDNTEGIKEDDILEIDENAKIDGVSDGVNEGVSEGVKLIVDGIKADVSTLLKNNFMTDEPIFDWNGESGKTTNEITKEIVVKLEDLPSGGKNLVENVHVKPIEMLQNAVKNTAVKEKVDLIAAESKLNIDPDEISPEKKRIHEMLVQQRKDDIVMKKV